MNTHTGKIAAAILVAALAGLIAGGGCAGPTTARGRHVVTVLCKADDMVQPVAVPVIIIASQAAGPAAPAIAAAGTLDVALIHPMVVKACADYMAKPDAVVDEPPAGALVATPVVVTVPTPKP